MKNNVINYFEDLGSTKSLKKMYNKKQITTTPHTKSNIKNAKIPGSGAEFLIKESDIPSTAAAIASSNMYNEIGIATPPVKMANSNTEYGIPYSRTIQQNISSIPGINTTMAKDSLEYMQITQQFWGKYKWDIFYNTDFRVRLLKIMTKECFDQLTSLFLVDELRTDGDRHNQNFFLYKQPNQGKYEGVIAIDLENMEVLKYCVNWACDFQNFIATPYSSMTPQQTDDRISYVQRVNDLRELIQDGVLSQNNIETIQAALNYNLPKEIKKACHDQGLFMGKRYNSIVTPVSKLHEYNRNTIGKDLGL